MSGPSTSGVHVGLHGSQSVTDIQEVEPNNSLAQAQILTGDSLITVHGRAEVGEVGASRLVNWDDIEDMFRVTTQGKRIGRAIGRAHIGL